IFAEMLRINFLIKDLLIIVFEYMTKYEESIVQRFNCYSSSLRGITIVDSEIYAIAASGTVCIFNLQCKLLRSWSMSHDNSSTYGQYIVANNNEIFVSSYYASQVLVFNKFGTFIRSIGNHNEMKDPCGIAIKNDKIYISDYDLQNL